MLADFKNYLQDNKLSDNTINSYISDLKKFMKYYEDSYGETLTKLNKADIKIYISYLKNHLDCEATTINRYLSALKNYNEYLVSKQIQYDIVITKKDYIKIQSNFIKEDVPEENKINKLRHMAIENDRDFCVLCLVIYGGFRASEIVNIKINHIKLENRYIEVIGKGNKYRTVSINDIMYTALDDYLKVRVENKINNEYLFIGKKSAFYGNKPLNRNFVNRILNKYNCNVNIENLHPHLLRHYFCTNAYYKAGYTLAQIASQAGHSSINTTMKYVDNRKKEILNLSNRL